MDNIQAVCDEILTYNVLHKRKLLLDTFAEGLEVFHLKSAFTAFPSLFEPLFMASWQCRPKDVLDIIKYKDGQLEGSKAQRVAGYLESYIENLEETGNVIVVCVCVCFNSHLSPSRVDGFC